MPVAAIVALIDALLQFAPQIPELIAGAGVIIDLMESDRAPTAVEQSQIESAMQAAHAAVQAAQ